MDQARPGASIDRLACWPVGTVDDASRSDPGEPPRSPPRRSRSCSPAGARRRRRGEVDGRGFGHGVGLSQYGAPTGSPSTARATGQILRHYYANTKLGRERRCQRPRAARIGPGIDRLPRRLASLRRAVSTRRSATTFAAAGGGVELRAADGRKLEGCGGEGKAAAEAEDRRPRALPRQPSSPERPPAAACWSSTSSASTTTSGAWSRTRCPRRGRSRRCAPRPSSPAATALATERSGAASITTRHPQPGLRRARLGDAADQQSGLGDRGRGRQVRGETAITYYFSTSGGQTENSEFGFSGGSPVALPEVRQGPLRRRLAASHAGRERLSDAEMESELTGLFSGRLQRIEILKTGRLAADRPRPGGRLVGKHDGHRRHPASAARTWALDLGEVSKRGEQLSRRRRAAAGRRDRSRASRARRRPPPTHSRRAGGRPFARPRSSRSEIEQLTVLCSGPAGSA